ncbi:MAG: HDIG domain-containing protein, partial [Candidatus Bathyarchaeia archaeon]
MMDRESALALVQSYVSKRNWLYHMLAVEAIMRGLATHLGEDEEKWGLLGLLHDIDFGKTESTPESHGLEAERILSGKVPEDIIRGIKAHNHDFT